jgi:hypothetical protein
VTDRFFPEALFEAGYTDLISVIPPGAQLVPSSTINQSQVGKIPGRRLGKRPVGRVQLAARHEATIDDRARQWAIDGSQHRHCGPIVSPAWTSTALDPSGSSQMIEELATRAKLGVAPIRTGRAPKQLLMYRTDEPFSRMRLWIKRAGGEQHLVEVLGSGQQYLVAGTHPVTLRAYAWDQAPPPAAQLTTITREQVTAYLDELAEMLEMLGAGVVEREGDGNRQQRVAGDQAGLLAPSIDVLRDAVRMIPNSDALFPQRDDYIRMGVAIRAAAGDENESEGFDIFAEWAARHEADGRVTGNPETWLSDWRRIKGPFALGWSWLAEQARGFGFNDAALDFDALEEAPEAPPVEAPLYSDQWLARRIADNLKGVLRYVPETGKYLVWSSGTWHQDGDLMAEAMIADQLRLIADSVARQGATPKEQRDALDLATKICSAGKANAVAQFLRSDRAIAVSVVALDHDRWIINTPGGIVDLRTGELKPSDPDALCTKATSVPPDFSGACPEWRRFLAETTGGPQAIPGVNT